MNMAIDNSLFENVASIAVGVPSLGVIIAYGISIIRRRASADKKALDEDHSYSEMLVNYRKERDEIRAERERIVSRMSVIESERNNAVAQVGRLTAEVEFLTHQVTDLKALVEKLGASLEIARTEMQNYAIDNASLKAQLTYLSLLKDPTGDDDEPK
jgi:chromosome segregation ATPase